MLDYLKRTDDVNEMIAIGRLIAEEKKDLYTPLMMQKMMNGVNSHIPDADPLRRLGYGLYQMRDGRFWKETPKENSARSSSTEKAKRGV